MAVFTNRATLSYSGRSTVSNTVVGSITEALTVTKTAVPQGYKRGDRLTYVITLTNSSSTALDALTLSDNLGATGEGADINYPLSYVGGSVLYYINGVAQASPTVTAGPPLSISGISVPASGNAVIAYASTVTEYADPTVTGSIENTVTVTGGDISAVTAAETVSALNEPELMITKSLSPTEVVENGRITYTFNIQNYGNTEAGEAAAVIVTDSFNPALKNISVAYNGTPWSETDDYTYRETTGVFSTVAGQITVPAASFTKAAGGEWESVPGTAVLSVSGTV